MINFNQIFTPEYYPYWISTGFLVLTIISLPIIYRKQKLWQKAKRFLFTIRKKDYYFLLIVLEFFLLLINATQLSKEVIFIYSGIILYVVGLILIIRYSHTQLKTTYENYYDTSIFNYTLSPLHDGIILIGIGMCFSFMSSLLFVPFFIFASTIKDTEKEYLLRWLENNSIKDKDFYLERPNSIFSLHSLKNLKK